MPAKKISVVGLGKLGLCLAAVLAVSGFDVSGVDVDKGKVGAVNEGKSPIFEPDLDGIIKRNKKRLHATTDLESAIPRTAATFVVVPTPSNETGEFSLRFVEQAMEGVGRALSLKKSYHLVVLTSTVMPGSMDKVVRPLLERSSGKVCGKDFGLCYNPEFIALGDVVRGLLEPDFVLIGESDEKAGRQLVSIQRKVCRNSPPFERMNFINAEIAKISLNSFVTMKMSFANTLAEISERLPGGDVDKITKAIGNDKRVGPRYLKGAQGYGGPCFPRDNIAFSRFAANAGVDAKLARATNEINENQIARVVALVEREALAAKTKRIGVLGLTYKPNTNVVEASQSLAIAEELARLGYEVSTFDPALPCGSIQFRNNVICRGTAEKCIFNSDVCVVATPWRNFAHISGVKFRGKTVIDLWRILGKNAKTSAAKYVAAGQQVV